MTDRRREFKLQQHNILASNTFIITGIILFRDSGFISKTIRFLTKGQFSHVGLLLENQNKMKFVYHSNGTCSQVLQRITPRVQINVLEDVLEDYDGVIAYRLLDEPINSLSVTPTLEQYLGVEYENNFFELIGSLWDLNKFNQNSNESVFCSELVAIFFQIFGLLDRRKCASNYLPVDFELYQLNSGKAFLHPLKYFKNPKRKCVLCCFK